MDGHSEVHPKDPGGKHKETRQERVDAEGGGQIFHGNADALEKVTGTQGFIERICGGFRAVEQAVIDWYHQENARGQRDRPGENVLRVISDLIFEDDHTAPAPYS